MTVPACMIAPMIAHGGGGVLSLSITQPLNGSTIPSNATPEAITGIAQSTAGNITTLQYRIDGGGWTNFTFTPAARVSYSGGNAGQLGVGAHVIDVKAIDAATNTVSVTSNYGIANADVASWDLTPTYVFNGNMSTLTVTDDLQASPVSVYVEQFDIHGGLINTGTTPLGTTDGSGNFTYIGTVSWVPYAYSGNASIIVGGFTRATFTRYNISASPSYSFLPSIAPNGTTIGLAISGGQGSAPVGLSSIKHPSGSTSGPTIIGNTDSSGNFIYTAVTAWGSDTSGENTVTVDGVVVGIFSFTP